MSSERKLNFKTIILSFFLVVIIVSFVILKIKDLMVAEKSIDQKNVITQLPSRDFFSNNGNGLIKSFASYQELESFVEENLNNTNIHSRNLKRESSMPLVEFATNELMADMADSVDQSVDFSETNIQVEGVDEADVVKTDGQYIYVLSDQDLYITESYPVEKAQVLSHMKFENQPLNIYLKDGKLVVFGNDFNSNNNEKIAIYPSFSSQVFLQVFDVSDPQTPIKEKDFKIDGSYFNSRLIGDHVYFIVNNYNLSPRILPEVLYQGEKIDLMCQEGLKCYPSEVYYFDTIYDSLSFSSIYSINIFDSKNDLRSSHYLLPASQHIYVSPNNIYLAYTKYLNEYDIESEVLLDLVYLKLSTKDRDLIEEIKNTSEKVLSASEKRYKIRQVLDLYVSLLSLSEQESLEKELTQAVLERYPNIENEVETTVIYKLSALNGIVEPMVEGTVPGSLLNQFSLDEYQSFFRVATTRNVSWSKYASASETSNNVYILDSNLQIISSLENMAPGERIYAVRFLGDQAYVVTFEQIDPLFSLDLSNPYHPVISGELKIPGFSNYLHPWKDQQLIGFGRATDLVNDRVVNTGLKLSLFDVSADTPVELDSYVIGNRYSESAALYDHHAFLASVDKNIIVVPVLLFADSLSGDYWDNIKFSGFLVFEIIDNQIKLKGEINHLKGQASDYLHSSRVQRALYIEDYLYSIFSKSMKISNLEDLKLIKDLKLGQ